MHRVADGLSPELEHALNDITVQPDGCVARLAGRTVEGNGPRHLHGLLKAALYEELHAGQRMATDKDPRELRDPAFESLLTAATPHRYATVRARLRQHLDGAVLVDLDGVLVRVPEGALLADPPDDRRMVRLSLPSARPAISPGFFLVDGSRGRSWSPPMLRIYVHLEAAEAAPPAWAAALRCLEDGGVRYRAKVCSTTDQFPRRDALVVYLGADDRHVVSEVAASVSGLAGVGDRVSVFTEEVAPGVSVGWEPIDTKPSTLSFGQHRATAVATGLIDHAMGTGQGSKAGVVAGALRDAGVDPTAPFRNLSSPPLHTRAAEPAT
ncbi:T3SS effector HopA1 family protein [Streptomyces sp. NPDC041003]|uniref:T3SS effector HopA1 family protein n=1 Tax=Streptomyces sp. NPDC041003 TaxID=3155730 RepID=UPI0033E39E8D